MKDRTLLRAAPEGADSVTAATPARALLQGSYHFLVSQAVDKRIEHGGHYGAQHSTYLVLVGCVGRSGSHVDEDGLAEIEAHNGQVGGASGQGFIPPLGRVHPEDCEEYEGIGSQDQSEWGQEKDNS